jgi:hypothetical protein
VPTQAPAPTRTATSVPTQPEPAQVELQPTKSIGDETLSDEDTLLFSDEFDDPQAFTWDFFNSETGQVTVSNGKLVLSMSIDNTFYWTNTDRFNIRDVMVEVEATLLSGSKANTHGIVCRFVDDDNFYGLAIGNSGDIEIIKSEAGVNTFLFQENNPSLIKPGENEITATCIGDELSLYVNNKLAGSVKDTTFASGDVGVIISTFDEPQVTIGFDDFEVYLPKGSQLSEASPGLKEGPYIPDSGTLFFEDDFEEMGLNDWELSTDPELQIFYSDGEFNMQVLSPMIYTHSQTNAVNLEDVVLSVDAYRKGGDEENLHGFVCRLEDNDNFYGLGIGNDGYAVIFMELDGDMILLKEKYIAILDTEFNKLVATCIGDELSLYAGNQLIITTRDETFSLGDVGLLVGSYSSVPVEIGFDNFEVYTLD